MAAGRRFDPVGGGTPFTEPGWYQGSPTPYYTESHAQFRDRLRQFIDTEIRPHAEEWIEAGRYPPELHERFYESGLGGAIFDKAYGGTPPPGYNAFHELILFYELGRLGGGGILGQLSINSMALPPIALYGSERIKNMVLRSVVTGKKHLSLAISEPGGEDVWVISGVKKWITGGMMADWFTMLVRTGGPKSGAAGLSLILVPRDTPGITVRKMKTQFDNSHNTTMITLEDAVVPAVNLIGEEGKAFKYVLVNFNHERFVIAAATAAMARECFSEAIYEATTRRTFGKPLVDHQVIRAKLAEMARLVESLQDTLERVAYQFACGIPDRSLGSQCALLKVQASKTFEQCAREASQIFGGSSVVREGRGARVERMYREVRAQAIPGGSEEILLDLAIRQSIAKSVSARL